MRINRIKIVDFRNLRHFEICFAKSSIDTDGNEVLVNSHAIIGQNGSGKSNLLEAIITIFRDLDLKNKAEFSYELDYTIRDHEIEIKATVGNLATVDIDKKKSSASFLSDNAFDYLPSNIFAYYSGKNDRIEKLFHRHQNRFYQELLRDENIPIRRLFLCRNVHSQFVLLAYLIDNDKEVKKILFDMGIIGLESVLFALKRPYWFGSNPSEEILSNGDNRFWYARGKVRTFLAKLWEYAIAPIDTEETRTVDFRDRKEKFELLYLFLQDEVALKGLAQSFSEDIETEPTPVTFFKYLESTYISDLIDEVSIKVKHKSTENEISFRELSEGEQQLLTVLGLMRLTKEDEALFLLDEPDTHLNPIWKLRYFDDIQNVIGNSPSQILITTHDPLMIGGLKKEQVRVLNKEEDGIMVATPVEDPQGMGVSGLLKSDMFGLQSTLDRPTREKLIRRNELIAKAGNNELNANEKKELEALRIHLDDLGFAHESRDPMYQLFIKKMYEARSLPIGKLFTKKELEEQDKIAEKILIEMTKVDKQKQIADLANSMIPNRSDR